MYVNNCCMYMRAHDLENRQHCECFCLFVCIKKHFQSAFCPKLSHHQLVSYFIFWVSTAAPYTVHSMRDRELESESRKRACVQKRIQTPCICILIVAPWCHVKLELSLSDLFFPRSKINSVNTASSREIWNRLKTM